MNMKTLVVALIAVGAAGTLLTQWPLRSESNGEGPSVAPTVPPSATEAGGPRDGAAASATTTRSPAEPVTSGASEHSRLLVRDIELALATTDERQRERAFAEMLPALIALDAPAAGRLVERLDPGPTRDELRAHVVRLWLAQDLDGTLAWVSALEDEGERKLAATDVTAELAKSNPAAAIEIADRFDIGRDDGTLERVVQLWTETDPDKAIKWIESQPPGPARDQLLTRIATVHAARDPEQAAALVSEQMKPGDAQRGAAIGVLREWAVRDEAAALQWLDRFPPGRLRDEGRAEIARAMRLSAENETN